MVDVATPTEQLGSATGQASDALQDKTQEVSQQLRRSSDQAQRRVVEEVTVRSRQAGEQVDAVGRALRSSADQLRGEGQGAASSAVEQAVEKLDQLAEYLKRSDGDRILSDLENFGRRQPWAVILGGVTVGFAVSRFLKASSSRRYEAQRTPSVSMPSVRHTDAPSAAPSSRPERVELEPVDERLARSGYPSNA